MTKKEWAIDWSDRRMGEWACNYLSRYTGGKIWATETYYEAYNRLLKEIASREAYELLTMKMKGAWRQKQHRDRQTSLGKKICSFTLTKNSVRELNMLAKEIQEPLQETLEQIIQNTYFEYKEQKRQNRLTRGSKSYRKLRT